MVARSMTDLAADPPSPASGPRCVAALAEVGVSFGSAALLTLLAMTIEVDPVDRVGQVSGLASLGWHYTLLALSLVIALVLAARVRNGARFPLTARLTCAAIAGMATGIVAGGIVVALHGTPWGLNAAYGDAGKLIEWTDAARSGRRTPRGYPPLPFHVIGWYADRLGLSSGHVMKHMQVIGTAMMGPVVYLCWRLVLRPTWALALGVVASLPLIDSAPYRPYANLVLMVFVPIAVWFLGELRNADQRSVVRLARAGAVIGGVMGVLCLTYSGWFQWSAPGFLVAMLVVFPWRRAPRRGLVLVGFAALMFAAVSWRYVLAMLKMPVVDSYIYFDVHTEPAYIAMYRGDLPGAVGMWPPLGELGGVGLFTLVLAAGLGVSVALGRARTLVITVGALFAGAWALRFCFAHALWQTKNVQLYPRTTVEILHCLLLLTVFAACLVVERLQRRAAADSPVLTPSGTIGVLCALLFVFASTGSSIASHYMPDGSKPLSPGWLAHQAQQIPR
jgi:galactan 5-O-arabinofuranosyltransferase